MKENRQKAAIAAPKVTAIIIVFNGETYLREAIESIIGQTFANWELIIVDDGSSDSSGRIARSYEGRQPERIRVITHPDGANHGMAAARNLGIAHARGVYIGFLDADDIWLPTKLEEQVAILDGDPTIGLVYGRSKIWHSWSSAAVEKDYFYPLGVASNATYAPPKLLEVLLENKAQSPTTCNALMRADLVRKVRGFEERFRGMFEDQTFFARALACSGAYVSDRHWANYRQHDASCSAAMVASGRAERVRLTFLFWLARIVTGSDFQWQARLVVWRAFFGAGRVLGARALKRRIRFQ